MMNILRLFHQIGNPAPTASGLEGSFSDQEELRLALIPAILLCCCCERL